MTFETARPWTPAERGREPSRGVRIARTVAIVVLVIAAVVALAIGIAQAVAPRVIRSMIVHRVHAACPACQVDVGTLNVRLLEGRAFATNTHVLTPPHRRVQIDARIDHIDVNVSWWTVLIGRPHVQWIRLRGAHLTVLEDPTQPHRRPSELPSGQGPRLVVDHLVIDDGDLAYRRLAPRGRGTLRSDHVSLHVSAFGLRPGVAPRWVNADVSCRIAQSGDLRGTISLDPFSQRGDVRGHLTLRGLDVDRLDTYLRPVERVRAHGEVIEAHSEFAMTDGFLRLHLGGRYRNFTVDFGTSPRRGPVRAKADEVGERVLYRRDVGIGGPEGWADVTDRREANEGLFATVWKQLGRAATRIGRGKH